MKIIKKLQPSIEKRDTIYRCTILIDIKVVCSLYKVAHEVNYLQCSELFAFSKSFVNMVLHEFVVDVNVVFLGTKFGDH